MDRPTEWIAMDMDRCGQIFLSSLRNIMVNVSVQDYYGQQLQEQNGHFNGSLASSKYATEKKRRKGLLYIVLVNYQTILLAKPKAP
jgi:hypothetical protein